MRPMLVLLSCVLPSRRFFVPVQPVGGLLAAVFCLTLNMLLYLVPEYHMMDMNIITLITISLLMVSYFSDSLLFHINETFCWRFVYFGAQGRRGQQPFMKCYPCLLKWPDLELHTEGCTGTNQPWRI